MDKAPSDHITPWSEHLRSVTAERLGATKSNSGVSDQQSVGLNLQPCLVLKQHNLFIASAFGWDVKLLARVLCNACKEPSYTNRKFIKQRHEIGQHFYHRTKLATIP